MTSVLLKRENLEHRYTHREKEGCVNMNAATGIIHLSISQRTPKIGSKTSKATEGTNPDNTLIWTAMLQN